MRKMRKKTPMKLPQLTLSLLVSLACTAVQANGTAVPLLGKSLNSVAVFANTYATTGADSTVVGDTSAVGGYVRTGGAATVGANAKVVGKVEALGAITLSASSKINGTGTLSAMPLLSGIPAHVLSESQQVSTAQAALKNMGLGTALATTMASDTTLYPGVFSAANLSATAGITLTLDGQHKGNQSWVFNIEDYLVTGASTKIVLINSDASDSVIWNSGGYASLGASATFIGTILAKDYISVGANTSVTGIGTSCGGIFSATSYVSAGDGARIGGNGCNGIGSGFNIVDGTAVRVSNIPAVPEPSIYWMLAAGLGLLGLLKHRKQPGI